jgi:hypothetical protein
MQAKRALAIAFLLVAGSLAASPVAQADAADCTAATMANPRPAGWFLLGKPGQAFADTCFHQFMVNEPDSATTDVVILPPAGPLALRDISLLRQSVQMWEDGVKGMAHATGRSWLAEGFQLRPFVLGLDAAVEGYAEAVADPEVLIVTADAEGGAVTGFVGQGSDQIDFCHGVPDPMPSGQQVGLTPGFTDHHGYGWGTMSADCGDWGGRVCVVAQAALFVVPNQQMALDLFDLNSHEFGHCIGLGHVGDASDFAAMSYPPDDIMSYAQDTWSPGVGLCVSNLDVKTLAYRYGPLIEGAPAVREPGFANGYMTMAGGKHTWPGNVVGPEYLGTSWRILREDGTQGTSATECPQPTVDLLADPLAIPVPKAYEGTTGGGSPTVSIASPAAGATGVVAPVTVSGTVDRDGSSSTSTSTTTTTTTSSTTTTTGGGGAPDVLHFTAARAGTTPSPDCGNLPTYRMEAAAPTAASDSKAYAARGFGPIACPMGFAATTGSAFTLPEAVQVQAWIGCDLPSAAPQDAAGSAIGFPYNVDWTLTVNGVDVPGSVSGSGGPFLCDGSAALPIEATLPTGSAAVPAGAVLGLTASVFWPTLGADDPQPNVHIAVGSVAHDSRLVLDAAAEGSSAAARVSLWDRIVMLFTGDEAAGAAPPAFGLADVLPPSQAPSLVATASPRPAPAEAPEDPHVADPAADVTGLGVAPIDHMDIRAAWFDSDADYLYVGLKLTDIPADPAATSQIAYTVNFMPTWATTWDGVAAGDRFDGLRVNALWSRADFNTFPPGTPASTTFSLEFTSATVNPQTGAETGHFGHVAAITGSVDAATDIVWFQVPREDLLSPADGDLLDTLSAAAVVAVGGLVTVGSFYGDDAQAANGNVSYALASGGGGGGDAVERVELYEGSTLLGTDEVTTSAGSPTAAWIVAGLELADGMHTLTAKWFDLDEESTGTPLDTATVSFTVTSGTDPCEGNVAPAISAVAADAGTTTATITWTTDKASSSVVHYGATSAHGSTATGAAGTAHSVALSGLEAASTYHYSVVSEDACGDESSSADLTFATDEEETGETAAFVEIASPAADAVLEPGPLAVTGQAGHVVVETVDPDSNGDGFVVIAVPDTGINPYHDDFSGALHPRNTDLDADNDVDFSQYPATYLDGFPAAGPAGATALPLTIDGSFNAAADGAKFNAVAMQTLYWIPGTKVIGAYDFNNVQPVNAAADAIHLLDEDGHGTASASVAVGNFDGSCPECLLVVVEGLDGGDWAFTQPWIDIVSTSGGPVANIPSTIGVEAGHMPTTPGQRAAAERGQSILYAGGNGCLAYVCPEQTYLSQNTGPAWTLDIGAIIRADDGHDESILLSGKPVTMSSYSAGAIPAACRTGTAAGQCQHSGTSAATPLTAGHFGEVLMEARRLLGSDGIGNQRVAGTGVVASGAPVAGSPALQDGVFTRAELWDIMFHSAQPLDSEPLGVVHFYPTGVPGSPADFAYAGYGLANEAMEAKAIKVLRGDEAGLDKSAAETFFTVDRAARDQLWGTWDDDVDTIGSDSAALQLDLPLASVPAASCTGTADAGTVSVYLDAVAPGNLLGTTSLDGPVGECSDGWSVDVDLSAETLGDHALLAVYDDGLAGSAQDSVAFTLQRTVGLAFGETTEVELAADTPRLFEIQVPAGHHLLSVVMAGPACEDSTPLVGACSFDADLFVNHGAPAQVWDGTGTDPNDCSPFLVGNDEACDLADPAEGTWYVLVDPFVGSGTVTLRPDLDLPDQDGDGAPDVRDADRDGDGLDNSLESLVGSDPGSDVLVDRCVPTKGTVLDTRDEDGDGQTARYFRDARQVRVSADGTVTSEPADCWATGDMDDDGTSHWPATGPTPLGALGGTSACIPVGKPTLVQEDFDGDGQTARYAQGGTALVTVGADGSVTTGPGPEYCWLSGDTDDDGTQHVPLPSANADGLVALIDVGLPNVQVGASAVPWNGQDVAVTVMAYGANEHGTYGAYRDELTLVVQRDCGGLEPAVSMVVDCDGTYDTVGGLLQPVAQTGNRYQFVIPADAIRDAFQGLPATALHVFVQTGDGRDSHFNQAKEAALVGAIQGGSQPLFLRADTLEAGAFTPIVLVDGSGAASSSAGLQQPDTPLAGESWLGAVARWLGSLG